MTEVEFKNLYENYIKNNTVKEDIKEVKVKWELYKSKIIGEELPLGKKENEVISWAKSREKDSEYLTNFIEKKSGQFGKPGQGSSMQYMIYKCSAADKKNLWYDKYQEENGKEGYIEDLKTVEDDYKEYILPLLKAILDTKTIARLAKIENGSAEDKGIVKLYKDFIDKQFLRKLAVLHFALDEEVSEKNSLLWIYDDDVVNNLVEFFESDVEETATYFEKSNAVWKKAAEWIGEFQEYNDKVIDNAYQKFSQLNNLLWELGKNNAGDLTNFEVPNVIYHGAPGTGKTYTTLQTVKLLCQGDNSRYKYCQFHPSYSYQDFIEGIKPMEIVEGNLQLKVVNGIFKQFCIEVKNKNENFYSTYKENNGDKAPKIDNYPHYYFIVDEINRGDLSRIFGETFSLLEPDYKDKDFSNPQDGYKNSDNLIVTPLSNVIEKTGDKKDLAYKIIDDKVYFGIPFNIHFIGLMNDVDKSIDTFDLALRRRFKWITKECDYEVISDKIYDVNSNLDTEDYINRCKKLNKFIIDKEKGLGLSKNYQLGQSYFMKIVSMLSSKSKAISNEARKSVFENYIETTLREYAREVCDENEIDDKIEEAKKAFGIK